MLRIRFTWNVASEALIIVKSEVISETYIYIYIYIMIMEDEIQENGALGTSVSLYSRRKRF